MAHSNIAFLGRVVSATVILVAHQLALATPACFAQPAASKQLTLLEEDEFSVRLRYPQAASLADKDWLTFEFRPRGEQKVEINSFRYNFNRVCLDAQTSELRVSGGMGQGGLRELFPMHGRGPITLGPKGLDSSKHATNYAMALLGLPPVRGYRVKVTVSVNIELKDGRRFATPLTHGRSFEFAWRYPTEDGFAAMRKRLKELLKNPNNHYSTGYLLGAFLKIPPVGDAVTAQELLRALIPRRDLAFSGRDAILRHLNEHHHDSQVLVEHVGKMLRNDKGFIDSQLRRLPNVWDESFREPLVLAFEKQPHLRDTILRHLAQHALVHKDNQALSRRLSEPYILEGQVKRLREEQIPDPTRMLRSLGMTRDRRLVSMLAPMLRDRRKITPPRGAHFMHLGGRRTPTLVCDAVADAILVILDGKPATLAFQLDPTKDRQLRDKRIDDLLARLADNPEFAAAVAANETPHLSPQVRQISRRWKEEQKLADLIQLAPHVKPGWPAERIRSLLGLPRKIDQFGAGSRWLYVIPSFRQSQPNFHWLKFDAAGKAIAWEVTPWDKAHQPQSAPPYSRLKAELNAPQKELWDDIFVLPWDRLMARLGAELFAIPTTNGNRRSLGRFEPLRDAHVVASQKAGKRTWLLCESPRRAPFALDLASGDCVDFAIEGLAIPGKRTPTIQSHAITAKQTAVLMVAGGDRETWPRPGNRPIYFWINFRTGQSRRFPTGWDLEYFSAEQTIAVFSDSSTRRKSVAIDVDSGKAAQSFSHKESNHVEFDWSNMDDVKPLLAPRRRMIGLSLPGASFPLGLNLQDPYVPSTKKSGNHVAFHVRGYGNPRTEGGLWLAKLETGSKPIHVMNGVRDYELLDQNRCLFVKPVLDESNRQTEAFVYDAAKGKFWNVLEGVNDLQEGECNIRVISSSGAAKRQLLVAITCTLGGDFRQVWRRWVLLRQNGARYLIDKMPDELRNRASNKSWLLESGQFVFAVPHHTTTNGRTTTRLQLHRIDFQ